MIKFCSKASMGLGLVCFSLSAAAAPISPNDHNDGVPDLYNAVNILTGSRFNDNDDLVGYRIDDADDQSFQINHTNIAIVGSTAGNTNTLGYYTDLGTGAVKISTGASITGFGFTGDGSAADAFQGTTLAGASAGDTLGLYLNSDGQEWFSEEALNSDGDHLIAYDLSSFGPISVWTTIDGRDTLVEYLNPVLVGFEDLALPGDLDYDDTMFLIDVTAVPVPAAFWLFGSALLGLVGIQRRKI